jgi:hypothetical protein
MAMDSRMKTGFRGSDGGNLDVFVAGDDGCGIVHLTGQPFDENARDR